MGPICELHNLVVAFPQTTPWPDYLQQPPHPDIDFAIFLVLGFNLLMAYAGEW